MTTYVTGVMVVSCCITSSSAVIPRANLSSAPTLSASAELIDRAERESSASRVIGTRSLGGVTARNAHPSPACLPALHRHRIHIPGG